MQEIFKDFYKLHNSQILVGTLPKEIMEELSFFISKCREIKNHPLSKLRAHENAGNNSFQVSIPTNLLMDSFFLAFLIRLGEKYFNIDSKKNHRVLRICNDINHFDGYAIWVNFSYKGDSNPLHSHSGDLSGVIYYQNDGQETNFKDGFSFAGKPGDVIIFPSSYEHSVAEKFTDFERITISFNLYVSK